MSRIVNSTLLSGVLVWLLCLCVPAVAAPEVDAAYGRAHGLYLDLHEHPELSGHEVQTAASTPGPLTVIG